MSEVLKVLGQADLAATTLTAVGTVPASKEWAVSSITICNRSATPTTYRLSLAVGGAADANKQYLAYDVPLPANRSDVWQVGPALAAADEVRAYAANTGVSVTVLGIERDA